MLFFALHYAKNSFSSCSMFLCTVASQSSPGIYMGHGLSVLAIWGWRISWSIHDSPAYLGTLDSSMDQKQWSKANTCRGDSTGSVNIHLAHLSKHVQCNFYSGLWLRYKNRLLVFHHATLQIISQTELVSVRKAKSNHVLFKVMLVENVP